MNDPREAENFLNDVLALRHNLRTLKYNVDCLDNTLSELGVGAIDYSRDKVQCGNLNHSEDALLSLISKIDDAKNKLISRGNEYTSIFIQTEEAINSIPINALNTRYCIIPEILSAKYLGMESDKDIMKKFALSLSTYKRYLHLGFSLFKVPTDIDWSKFL